MMAADCASAGPTNRGCQAQVSGARGFSAVICMVGNGIIPSSGLLTASWYSALSAHESARVRASVSQPVNIAGDPVILASPERIEAVRAAADAVTPDVLELTALIAAVPSPTGEEAAKSLLVERLFAAEGLATERDAIWRRRRRDSGPASRGRTSSAACRRAHRHGVPARHATDDQAISRIACRAGRWGQQRRRRGGDQAGRSVANRRRGTRGRCAGDRQRRRRRIGQSARNP